METKSSLNNNQDIYLDNNQDIYLYNNKDNDNYSIINYEKELKDKINELENKYKQLEKKSQYLDRKIELNESITLDLNMKIETINNILNNLELTLKNEMNSNKNIFKCIEKIQKNEINSNKHNFKYIENVEKIQERLENRFVYLSEHLTDIHDDLDSFRIRFKDLENSIKLYSLHTSINKEIVSTVKNNAISIWDIIIDNYNNIKNK